MISLCSASQSRTNVDLKGLSHPISLHADSGSLATLMVSTGGTAMRAGSHTWFSRI